MRNSRLRELLRNAPFRPIAIHLSDGARFVVRHPEFVVLGEHHLVVTEPGVSANVPDRVAVCDLVHVTHVEFLGNAA